MAQMLITQALDERDLLKKKISDAIYRDSFVAVKKVSRDTTVDNVKADVYTANVKATYQSIDAMIDR